MKQKTTAPQFELPTMEEVFNLAGERGQDGDRLAREQEAAAAQARLQKEREARQQPPLL